MILTAIKYTRYPNQSREWQIIGNNNDYAYFDNINLLVGKNASGKSRTLFVIKEIAYILSNKIDIEQATYETQRFDLLFENRTGNNGKKGQKLNYIVELKDRKVIAESLAINGTSYFSRNEEGINIDGVKELSNTDRDKLLSTAGNKLIISTTNEDNKFYFDGFYAWGKSIRNYLFSDQIEKNVLIKDLELLTDRTYEGKIGGMSLLTFYLGKKNFGTTFTDQVIDCMHTLGYSEITNIDIHECSDGHCIGVEEYGEYIVEQREMSQGMFRALSLFIFVNYSLLKNRPMCILIEDIAEGLDYNRSKKLIKLTIKKIFNSSIQCFMSTNDRYVMNDIPLRFWSVIEKVKRKSIFYDSINSKQVFEDFTYTGLNNFDFLATDFYKEGFGEDEENNNKSDNE